MGLKDILKKAKDKAQKAADDLNDPDKKEELDIERTQKALEMAQRGMAAYQNATEKFDSAKERVAKKLEGIEPVAEAIDEKASKIVNTGKNAVSGLTDKWKKFRGGKKSAANEDTPPPAQKDNSGNKPKTGGNTP